MQGSVKIARRIQLATKSPETSQETVFALAPAERARGVAVCGRDFGGR